MQNVTVIVNPTMIGESRADAVIACREEKGSFTSIEGIKDVAGIGEGIFNRIKDLITVN